MQAVPEGWELIGSSRTARVFYESQQGLYYKEFLPRGPLERVKALVKGSRATRARLNSDLLLESGFPAPENVAWGKLSGGREYLISRSVAGEGVARWLQVKLAGGDHNQLMQRRQLLEELGGFIGRVHAAGFIHGDLRPSNVLADWDGGQFRFALIDNERTLRASPPPGKLLLKNLMQLNMLVPADLSRSDRWRFFLKWQQQMEYLSPVEGRILAAEAYGWAMRRLAAKDRL